MSECRECRLYGTDVVCSSEEAYQRGREDAINDFVSLINEMPTYTVDGVLMPMPIEMIAEKVKEEK